MPPSTVKTVGAQAGEDHHTTVEQGVQDLLAIHARTPLDPRTIDILPSDGTQPSSDTMDLRVSVTTSDGASIQQVFVRRHADEDIRIVFTRFFMSLSISTSSQGRSSVKVTAPSK